MDWFGNPMYLAWLFENNRRRFYKYCTIVSAPLGFVVGVLLSFYALHGWTTIAQSDLALGSLVSLGLTVFVASCWYEGICKPHTELVESDTSEMELDDAEKEDALKYD